MKIQTVVDSQRGCGWRKPGGLYLRTDAPGRDCGKFPVPLEVCPCCHAGIKPSRGWTWINPQPFLDAVRCTSFSLMENKPCPCEMCPMASPPTKAGLLWIGEKFYKTPADWLKESNKLGVSRRISTVPHDFKIGETWVFVAHRLAITMPCPCTVEHRLDKIVSTPPVKDCPDCKGTGNIQSPGMFQAFKPDRIEYVTKGTETAEEIEDLTKRGITPVKVVRDIDQKELAGLATEK